jgi:hypothetical protein
MKADYRPVDENKKWGKRESWIGGEALYLQVPPSSGANGAVYFACPGCPSPQMPVVSKGASNESVLLFVV